MRSPLPTFLLACIVASSARAADPPKLIDFNVKGGWCWFQDERALVDGDRLLFGSVSCPAGDVQVTSYDLRAGTSVTVPLHARFQHDDHDAPAFLRLPDGRYLAAYASHGGGAGMTVKGTDLVRWRLTTRPGDVAEWGPEQTLPVGAGVSYANLYRLQAENGRIYNFHRGFGFNPNYLVSDDDGKTFRYGGRLFNWPATKGSPGSGRPYLRYASNGADTIHFLATEDHPRNFDNGIYHGYYKAGKLHRSDGAEVGPLSTTRETSVKPTDFTPLFKGDADHVAWCVDLRLDASGHPVGLFSVQVGDGKLKADTKSGGEDLRYFYARFDPKAGWAVHPLAYAGTRLYSPEVDYSGLAAIHPADPAIVYLSTNADPATGKPLLNAAGRRTREIFRAVTPDGGRTWTFAALTSDSPVDNIRPIARALPDGRAIVVWQRGTYRTYTDYDMSIVGLIDAPR